MIPKHLGDSLPGDLIIQAMLLGAGAGGGGAGEQNVERLVEGFTPAGAGAHRSTIFIFHHRSSSNHHSSSCFFIPYHDLLLNRFLGGGSWVFS